MRNSTKAKHDFVKLVCERADHIVRKKPKLRRVTALGIAFEHEARVISNGVAQSAASQLNKMECGNE